MDHVSFRTEVCGRLVAPAVFKTDVTEHLGQAGSIPVRLRISILIDIPRGTLDVSATNAHPGPHGVRDSGGRRQGRAAIARG